ncbi:MAG: single-stranded DNA-binding protein [Candidatus Vogelbacteria bacterium]
MYLNRAILVGNLTRDPELRSLPSGVKVASFSLATNRIWKDKNGAKQEDTQFHNIVVFAQQAEIVAQYLKKGQSALVEGRIQNRSWDAPDGTKKYRSEIVADRVQFGPKAGGFTSGGGGASGGGASSGGSRGSAVDGVDTGGAGPNPAEPIKTIQYPDEEINPADIPF